MTDLVASRRAAAAAAANAAAATFVGCPTQLAALLAESPEQRGSGGQSRRKRRRSNSYPTSSSALVSRLASSFGTGKNAKLRPKSKARGGGHARGGGNGLAQIDVAAAVGHLGLAALSPTAVDGDEALSAMVKWRRDLRVGSMCVFYYRYILNEFC